MTEAHGEFPIGDLRPARPRRESDERPIVVGSPELLAQVEELHEVVWSLVDGIADLRQRLTTAVRDLGAVRTGLAELVHQQDLVREATADPSPLIGIQQALSDLRSAIDERNPATPASLPYNDEALTSALRPYEARLQQLSSVLAATVSQLEALGDTSRRQHELNRRQYSKELKALRNDLAAHPAPPADEPPAPRAGAAAKRAPRSKTKPAEHTEQPLLGKRAGAPEDGPPTPRRARRTNDGRDV